MKAKKLMDIEVYTNYFLVGIKDIDTKEIINYEISEERDERVDIYNFFSSYIGFLITFNGIHYDNVVINYFIKEYSTIGSLSSWLLCSALKSFSDSLIGQTDYDKTKEYRNFKPIWIDIDLFLYWAMMLRKSKKISLKALGIQLNHEEVQELPFEPERILSYDETQELKRYNNVNDLGILEKLFNKQIEEVRLRRFIKQEYGLACWSMDAPKIAGEILLKEYSLATGIPDYEIRREEHSGYYGTIGDLLDDVNFHFKNPILHQVYKDILKCRRDFEKTFILNVDKTSLKISLGIGGIHTIVENKKFKSNADIVVYSSDVASLYPTLIINHKICRYVEVFRKYKQIRKERLIAKRDKLKQKDTLLKLILNSFSGLIDNQYSWLYYPEGALKLRIIGQLLELKALDECLANNIQVIALNTDSIDVLIERSRITEYTDLIDKIGNQYNVIFEHEQIDWTYYANINNYIQKSHYGKIKRKGLFKYGDDIPLGDSVNEQIIPKALELYFNEKISVKESISNPDKYGFHIYDYCLSKKISRDYDVFHNGVKVQNLNRYYFSKNAPYLFKKKKEKSKMEFVHVKEGVQLFNSFKQLPFESNYDMNPECESYKINYSYYIKKANDIIYGLEKSEIQISLF